MELEKNYAVIIRPAIRETGALVVYYAGKERVCVSARKDSAVSKASTPSSTPAAEKSGSPRAEKEVITTKRGRAMKARSTDLVGAPGGNSTRPFLMSESIGSAPTQGHSQVTYTIPEAMAYLRLGRTSIEQFIKRGLLRRSLASRKVIIHGGDVETFVERTSGVRR